MNNGIQVFYGMSDDQLRKAAASFERSSISFLEQSIDTIIDQEKRGALRAAGYVMQGLRAAALDLVERKD